MSFLVLRLLDRVQSEDPAWKESGAAFISSVTRLLERLLDYRSVIQGDENRDKRMSCTVNLLVCKSITVFISCVNFEYNYLSSFRIFIKMNLIEKKCI